MTSDQNRDPGDETPEPREQPWRPSDVFRCTHERTLKLAGYEECLSCRHRWEGDSTPLRETITAIIRAATVMDTES